MSVAVWRAHLFSCGWPAKHDHMGFPRKGAGKPHGNISKFYSKLSFTMAGGAFHKPRGHSKMELFCFLSHRPPRHLLVVLPDQYQLLC